jgi:GNAT superfamily N-acetyltransferase
VPDVPPASSYAPCPGLGDKSATTRLPLTSLRDVDHPEVLRPGTLDDIPAAAAIRASVVSDAIITPEGMSTWLSGLPQGSNLFLLAAEVEGRMVGWCNAWRNMFGSDPGVGTLDVVVVPDHQRLGLGTRLITRGLDHLVGIGIHTVRGSSVDRPGPRAVAARFGFAEVHASSTSAVDPRTVEPMPVPEGVTLRSFGEIDDPRPLYDLDLEVSRDVPGDDDFTSMTLEQWTGHFWRTVFADDDASLAAYVDGQLAALTMLRVDRPSHRAQNNLTGTRRAYRGRGLARLLKTHSLHRAAQAGATIAFTDNDETNAAMLGINHALGYQHSSRRVEWERRAPGA